MIDVNIRSVDNGFIVEERDILCNRTSMNVFNTVEALCAFLKEKCEEKRSDRLKNIDPEQARHLFK